MAALAPVCARLIQVKIPRAWAWSPAQIAWVGMTTMIDLECSGFALQSGGSLAEGVDAARIDGSLPVGNGPTDSAGAGRCEPADEQVE